MIEKNTTRLLKYIPILLIIIGFIVVKIPHLTLPHYWDESWSYATAVQLMYENGPTLIPGSVDVDATRGHPLLFYAEIAAWMKIFGPTLLSKHSFALLISTLLLIALYEVTYRFYNIRAAILATVLLASQIFFFVQSSMLLPEVLVALLIFISIYCFVCEKYAALALALSLLFLTKESGLILGLTLGCTFIGMVFSNAYLRENKIKTFIALGVSALVIMSFFIIQKLQYGWFFFPEHIGLLDYNLNDFSSRFQNALFVVFIGEMRQWFWIILALLTVLYTIKKRDYRGLLFVGAIAIIFALKYVPLDIFKKPVITFALITYILLILFIYRAAFFSSTRQNSFIIIAVLFCLVYLAFCAVNFYSDRYIMPVLLLSLYIYSFWLDTILEYINIRLYIPVCGMLILLSIHSFRSNNNIGDIGLGSYNALKVQKGVIDFLTNEEAQNKQISTGSFQQKVNMQNAASGFISSTQESFHNIQWEIDSLSDYVIFDNIEPDSRYETIKNDSHYTMVYQIKKGNVWGAVFTKALH